MLFNSGLYGVFLLAVYAVFWALTPARNTSAHGHASAPASLGMRRSLRALFLVVASYVFYFYGTYDAAKEQPVPLGPLGWSVLCLGIIFVGSSLDFAIGKKLGETEDPKKRKALLLVSIAYYLGVLAFFKYWNFGVDTVVDVARMAGIKLSPFHLRLALPFGISFFTFETMSYTIDVYRREIPPAKRYLDYLLFVAFFPHLVAGPIVRPHSMLPQFAREPVATDDTKARGLFLITTGLAKKIVIGDTLSVNLVARVFDNPERYSSLEGLVAIYAYAIQIYCDFSGYTDVAIGSALLFGYELPKNFDAPYTSRDLQEFWRRWHMTLSRWLRDYLYISLGGNRGGALRTYRNLFLTMLIGGLWHGARWTFVAWGAYHGILLAIHKLFVDRTAKMPKLVAARKTVPYRAIATIVTLLQVMVGWVFFRAETFEKAKIVLLGMVHAKGPIPSYATLPEDVQLVVKLLVVVFVMHVFGVHSFGLKVHRKLPAPLRGLVWASFAYACFFYATSSPLFIYFNF